MSGVKYFETSENKNNGSLIKGAKSDFGVDLLEGLINRYFKEHEIPEILKHKDNIVEYLTLKHNKEVTEINFKKKKKAEQLEKERLIKEAKLKAEAENKQEEVAET